jgi:rod shape-determining protein MreD
MRWIPFAILLYVVTALQSAAVPFVAVNTIRPDLMILVVVHYALAAGTYDALLACWCVGLAVDLSGISFQNQGNVGVHAFSMGVVAFCIVKVRSFIVRDSLLAQVLLTFTAKLGVDILVGLHMMYAIGGWSRMGDVLTKSVYAAIYTAVLAPYGHWILRNLRNVLGTGTTQRLRMR